MVFEGKDAVTHAKRGTEYNKDAPVHRLETVPLPPRPTLLTLPPKQSRGTSGGAGVIPEHASIEHIPALLSGLQSKPGMKRSSEYDINNVDSGGKRAHKNLALPPKVALMGAVPYPSASVLATDPAQRLDPDHERRACIQQRLYDAMGFHDHQKLMW